MMDFLKIKIKCRRDSAPIPKANLQLIATKLKGFGDKPKTLGQFIAINSGQFIDPSTWEDEIVPYGNCSIIITSSVVVTISKAFIGLNMRKCDIYGTLILDSSSYSSVTFGYRSNVIVHASGFLQDHTSGNVINCAEGALLTIYLMGSFAGKDTVVNSISTAQTTANQTRSVKLSSDFNDPFTCGILSGGSIEKYDKVTYIVSQSGDFIDDLTCLGNVAPTTAICELVGGCGMSISAGFILSTVDLNSELNMNFNDIIIAVGAVLQLGAPDSNNIFKFKFQILINSHGTLSDIADGTGAPAIIDSNVTVSTQQTITTTIFTLSIAVFVVLQSGGTLQDQTSTDQFYCLAGLFFTFYPGSSFIGANTKFFTYSSMPSTSSLGSNYTFGSNFSGSFTLGILLDGSIKTFSKVTFIVRQTGKFSTIICWLGNIVPTANICSLVGGCGLYIPSGCALLASSLNGQLNINFNLITIVSGGSLGLGSNGVHIALKFKFTLELDCLEH
ncbi:unnamed protein product [Rotaria socialis]|uniref:Uncharacterized protein n=1 Tax=Rotaria socialis TaxID=392032 RepID=A0A820KEC1_9BILA|nr:unnamed protein product [Rotaria socialis]